MSLRVHRTEGMTLYGKSRGEGKAEREGGKGRGKREGAKGWEEGNEGREWRGKGKGIDRNNQQNERGEYIRHPAC